MKLLEVAKRELTPIQKEIYAWCDEMQMYGHTVTPAGVIHCTQNVDISEENLTKLPYQFGTIAGDLNANFNPMNSFVNFPSRVDSLTITQTKFNSLQGIQKYIKKMDGGIWARKAPIKSHILGVFFIEGCTKLTIDNEEVTKIVNKHLAGRNRDVHACQEELIKAGFKDYAKI